MKIGDTVYINGEHIDTPVTRALIKGGEAEIEEILNETETTITCLVYFTDDRYEQSVQRLFYKNNLPQTLTKERIMATRKKSSKKKATKKAAKKVAKKKAAKKTVKKSAKKKTEGKAPLSRFISALIVAGNLSDEKIVDRVQKEYPDYKHAGIKAVEYYRNFLNLGKMERAGFPKPKKPYEPIGSSKKTTSKKTSAKKTAKRKVATRKR